MRLFEGRMRFKGKLPDPVLDETRIPARPERLHVQDPLQPNEEVHCLQFLPDPQLGSVMEFVAFFSLQFGSSNLERF